MNIRETSYSQYSELIQGITFAQLYQGQNAE